MIIFSEKRKVAMTEDKKCIIRGTAKSGYILCTISEKSRAKIRLFRNVNGITYINKSYLKLSEEVIKLYNTTHMYYMDAGIPEIIPCNVVCNYEVD